MGLATALLAACSSHASLRKHSEADKRMPVPPGKALVYLYRPSPAGGTTVFDVAVNGAYIGKTLPGSYYLIEAPAGALDLQSLGDNTAELQLKVRPGKRYYVRQRYALSLFTGRASMAVMDPTSGRRGLAGTSLLGEIKL
ncbi:MAG TPA: DUF2846 domain-containing protein [bacterium]|nr:DUF2846 domain-containing protein [bacterium]